MLAEGKLKHHEIADKLGAKPVTVKRWRRHPGVLRALERIQDARATRVGHRLAALEESALAVYEGVLDGTVKAGVREKIEAARDILKINGRTPKQSVVVEHTGSVEQRVTYDLSGLTPEQLRALRPLEGE